MNLSQPFVHVLFHTFVSTIRILRSIVCLIHCKENVNFALTKELTGLVLAEGIRVKTEQVADRPACFDASVLLFVVHCICEIQNES
jgi:hypothetical protein